MCKISHVYSYTKQICEQPALYLYSNIISQNLMNFKLNKCYLLFWVDVLEKIPNWKVIYIGNIFYDSPTHSNCVGEGQISFIF